MARRIQLRRDTATNWTGANPRLAQGEIGLDLTSKKIKIGDGVTLWNALAYWDDKETDLAGYATTQYVDDAIGAITIPADVSDLTDTEGLLGQGSGDQNVWIQTFETVDGAPTDIVAIAVSVEYDSAGNVIALFSHYSNEGGNTYYSVGKYTTTGTKIWTARFADGFDTDGWGLAVDNDSNSIYVAGESEAEGGQDNATLTKLDATDGSIIWSKTYDFGFNSQSSVVDVASDGNPVMVGYAYNGTDDYVATTKVDAADGSIIWTRSLDGQGYENAYGMAVGPTGEIVAIGYMSQLGEEGDTDDHMLVVKYDSTGSIQWQKAILFDTGFNCSGADADIDSAGNIYVTGSYQYYDSDNDTTTSALSILKLDSTGAKQWSRRVVGDCETVGVSVVVGADDKLYLSGITGNNNTENNAFTWVAAKYGIDGTVEWQRLIDNTTGWSFTGGIFFSDGGGSNIAVKQDYVLLGGGFGNLAEDIPQATVVQVSATGDVFSVGDWDFKAATFSGILNDTASDITVVNAGKTDTDNSENITTTTVELDTEVSGFLLGRLYTVGDSSDRLVNGEYEIVLGSTGAVTLPQGGTITEGVVTDNPTIELIPANPDAVSQKLVIKGGLPPEEPTDYHLHLTTGALNETSIFLGTDEHNVRTTIEGKIQITTPNESNNVWEFGTNGSLTLPAGGDIVDSTGNSVLSGDTGDITFDGATISAPDDTVVRIQAKDSDSVVRSYVRLDPDNGYAEMRALSSRRTEYFSTSDWSTAEWTGTGGSGNIAFTDASNLISFLNNQYNGQNRTFSINGGEYIAYDGFTGDSNNIILYTLASPPVDPTTVTSIEFRYNRESRIEIDYDDDEINIIGRGLDVDIETDERININANGSVEIGSDTSVALLNNSATNPIIIRTNNGNTNQTWEFAADGKLTLPGAVVKSTVARTGVADLFANDMSFEVTAVDEGGVVTEVTITNTPNPAWQSNGAGTGVTFGDLSFIVQVDGSGNATVSGITSSGGHTIGETFTVGGDSFGAEILPTAIDLTKSVNKLTPGYYTLADGVEGQVMYLVRQTGLSTTVEIIVAHARNGASEYTDYAHYPFAGTSSNDLTTLIFTDGHWQSSGDNWD